jgi:hypothetical protein
VGEYDDFSLRNDLSSHHGTEIEPPSFNPSLGCDVSTRPKGPEYIIPEFIYVPRSLFMARSSRHRISVSDLFFAAALCVFIRFQTRSNPTGQYKCFASREKLGLICGLDTIESVSKKGRRMVEIGWFYKQPTVPTPTYILHERFRGDRLSRIPSWILRCPRQCSDDPDSLTIIDVRLLGYLCSVTRADDTVMVIMKTVQKKLGMSEEQVFNSLNKFLHLQIYSQLPISEFLPMNKNEKIIAADIGYTKMYLLSY